MIKLSKLISEIKIIPNTNREQVAKLFDDLFDKEMNNRKHIKGLGSDLYDLRQSYEEYRYKDIRFTDLIKNEKLFSIDKVQEVYKKLLDIKSKYKL